MKSANLYIFLACLSIVFWFIWKARIDYNKPVQVVDLGDEMMVVLLTKPEVTEQQIMQAITQHLNEYLISKED